MKKLLLLTLPVSVLLIFYSSGCKPPNTTPPPKGIKEFTSSVTRANPNDQVTLRWSYHPNTTAEQQILYFHRFSFYGIQKDSVIIPTNSNEYTFPYAGAATIQLKVKTGTDKYSAILNVKSVRNFFMKATVSSATPLAPYLGYRQTADGFETRTTIDFTNYIAFYNVSGVNNPTNPAEIIIDDLRSVVPDGEIFRGRSFLQGNSITLFQGSKFPFNVPNQVDGGATNVIVYGGAIVFGYTDTTTFKANDSEGVTFFAPEQEPQPIFVAITCMYLPAIREITISDIQLGNTAVSQNLITAAMYYNSVAGSSGSTGQYTLNLLDFNTSAPTVNGEIKGAQTIFPMDPITNRTVTIQNLNFNMDLVADNALFNYLSQPQNR